MKNKSILIRATEELETALRQYAAEQNQPVSWVIREMLTEGLKARGIEVKDTPSKWGGKRDTQSE